MVWLLDPTRANPSQCEQGLVALGLTGGLSGWSGRFGHHLDVSPAPQNLGAVRSSAPPAVSDGHLGTKWPLSIDESAGFILARS